MRIGHEAAYYCADFGWLMKMEFAGAAELSASCKILPIFSCSSRCVFACLLEHADLTCTGVMC